MTCAEDIGILLRCVGDLVERCNAAIAGELEDMCLVLDDANVDVATLERIDTRTSIDRVLVLNDLNHLILLVGAITVTSKIVHVQEVRLSTLAGHNTHPSDTTALKLAWQELEWGCSEI